MEGFTNKGEKNKKKKLSSRLRNVAFLGAAAVATSSLADTPDKNAAEQDLSLKNDTSSETNSPEHQSGINYDRESNTMTIRKSESEEIGFGVAFTENMPNRFFEFDKYKEFSIDAKTVAAVVCEAYNELESSEREDLVPKSIFNDENYMSVQLAESGYEENAKSWVGAVGVMQNMKDSIIDLDVTIDFLRKKGLDLGETGKISDQLAAEIQEIIKIDSNLGRSFGKLYLNSLYFRYKIEDSETLFAAYNYGPRANEVDSENWPKETKDYVVKINLYKDNLIKIKQFEPSVTNSQRMRIARDFGHENGGITEEFIALKLKQNNEVASL